MIAVAYIRVSSRAQDHATQRSAIERFASARGDTIGDWRAEKRSAKTMAREELQRLLADARAGRLRGRRLYLFRLDRLTRSGIADTLTTLDEPLNWVSAVSYVQFKGKKLQSVTLQPIVLNNVGKGQPDIHDGDDANQFTVTRGLPAPATGVHATDILKRMAEISKPFGTKIAINSDGTGTIPLSGK